MAADSLCSCRHWSARPPWLHAAPAAMAIATIWDTPKPLSALHGLVWGYAVEDEGEAPGTAAREPWYKSPLLWGIGALVLCVLFYIYIEVV